MPIRSRYERQAAPAALAASSSDESDRDGRVGEDRGADLDRHRADGQEVEDVGELRDAADRDDRDPHGLDGLVHDPQRDGLDGRSAQPAVDVAQQRPIPARRERDPGQRVDGGQRIGAGVSDRSGDRPDVGDVG